jgi:hypothetical protein
LHVMKGNNIAVAEGNQRNIGKKSTAPYLKYFCRNNRYGDPKSCAEGLFNIHKKLRAGPQRAVPCMRL